MVPTLKTLGQVITIIIIQAPVSDSSSCRLPIALQLVRLLFLTRNNCIFSFFNRVPVFIDLTIVFYRSKNPLRSSLLIDDTVQGIENHWNEFLLHNSNYYSELLTIKNWWNFRFFFIELVLLRLLLPRFSNNDFYRSFWICVVYLI